MTINPRSLTLPIRFALFSLVISLAGILLITTLIFNHSDTLLNQQALGRIAEDLAREKSVLTTEFQTAVDDVGFIAQSSGIQGIIRASKGNGFDDQENMTLSMWRSRLGEQLLITLQKREAYAQIHFIGIADEGREIVRVERNGRQFLVADKNIYYNKKGEDYFVETIKMSPAQIYLSKITLNREQGKISYPPQPTLTVASPVYDKNGHIFGLVVIDINFDKFAASLYKTPKHIYFFLANQQGEYLIHPDKDKRMAFEFEKGLHFQNDFPIDFPKNKFSFASLIPSLDQGIVIKRFGFSSFGDEERFLTLGIVAELSLLEKLSNVLFRKVLWIVLACSIFLALITLYAAQIITRPLRLLTLAANEVATGNHHVEIPVEGGSIETQTLAHSICSMLDHILESQEDLAILNQSLEQKVIKRTQELSDAKEALQQSNLELKDALIKSEAAAESKSRFLATMSHEIRTPMNGVLGMTELVLATDLNRQQRDYMETIHVSGEALLMILNDILDYSKLEVGLLKLVNQNFSPNELVEQVTRLFAKGALDKNLELMSYCDTNFECLLNGDTNRLRQVLMNLLSNAIKFTSSGEIIIRINCLSETSQKTRLRFEVQDTGIGISKRNQSKLFKLFSQIDSSSTREYSGTGLGLSVSKQLIELMGGIIGVNSCPNQGSTFWFEVDFAKGVELKTNANAECFLQNKKILVIDDNATNRKLLQEVLYKWGGTVELARDAYEAIYFLEHAKQKKSFYDYLLIDQMMPGMDGIELIVQIRKDVAYDGIKIIMLSSMDNDDRSDKELDSFKIPYLQKPIRQTELYHILHSVVEQLDSIAFNSTLNEFHNDKENRVLLVEDTPVNQQVILGMLKYFNFDADLATNGEEAIESYKKKTYDLILMDIQMPIMDGDEACLHIRKLEQENNTRHTPIIAVTAHALVDDVNRFNEAKMDGYIAKPLKKDALKEVLDKWMPKEAFIKTAAIESKAQENSQPDESKNETPSVNFDTLQKLQGMIGSGLAPIITNFLNNTPQQLVDLKNDLDTEDIAAVRRHIHRLIGTSSNLGTEMLILQLQELSTAVKADLLDDAQKIFLTITQEFAEVEQILKSETVKKLW